MPKLGGGASNDAPKDASADEASPRFGVQLAPDEKNDAETPKIMGMAPESGDGNPATTARSATAPEAAPSPGNRFDTDKSKIGDTVVGFEVSDIKTDSSGSSKDVSVSFTGEATLSGTLTLTTMKTDTGENSSTSMWMTTARHCFHTRADRRPFGVVWDRQLRRSGRQTGCPARRRRLDDLL